MFPRFFLKTRHHNRAFMVPSRSFFFLLLFRPHQFTVRRQTLEVLLRYPTERRNQILINCVIQKSIFISDYLSRAIRRFINKFPELRTCLMEDTRTTGTHKLEHPDFFFLSSFLNECGIQAFKPYKNKSISCARGKPWW